MFHSQLTWTPVGNTGKSYKDTASVQCHYLAFRDTASVQWLWLAKTQQVSMPLLSPLMRVSLTIKDTRVLGWGACLTTPCKQRIEHTSASRSRSLFQQQNSSSVKCRTTEDICPWVSCTLGVYKSKRLSPIARSTIHSQTNSSHLHYTLSL